MRAVGLAACRVAMPTSSTASPMGIAAAAGSLAKRAKLKSTNAFQFALSTMGVYANSAEGRVKAVGTVA